MTQVQNTEQIPAAVPVPAECGVVGGGRMGAGIVHALLLAGARVTLLERDAESLDTAAERVRRAVFASADRGKLDDPEGTFARLAPVVDAAALGSAELVVEAVPEDLQLKLDTLKRIEAAVGEDAVVATNTSSISLDTLGDELARPHRFLGLHFFNPVPASKLIEVVITDRTDAELRDQAAGWVAALGKTAVVVKNSPGFASSRLGVALGLEAIRMVQEGVASAADIDAAMELGYGHPTGPLKLTDLVGIDVRLGIARYLQGELGDRFAPPALMVEMVERGELGRKSGKGFYDWSQA